MLQVQEDFDSQPSAKKEVDKVFPKVSVSLPSKGVFYPDGKDTIQVSPFSVAQVRRIYSATLMGDNYLVESTMASVIDDCVHDFNVFDLTVGDYDYLRKWIRINSYKKSPVVIRWTYEPTPGETKTVVSRVMESSMIVKELESHYRAPAKFSYTTVRDHLDILKMEDKAEIRIAEFASFLRGKNLAEKIAALEKMEAPDILPEIRAYQDRVLHGVDEYVLLKDEEIPDGSPVRVRLDLQPADYFP